MGQTPEWFSKAMGYGQSISGMKGAGVSPWVSEARGSTMYRSSGTALRGERFYVFLTFLCVLSIPIGGCEEQNKSVARDRPVIEFTSIAVAGAGDPDKLSAIRGRVSGARPGQQIVLYAKGETAWWVQPFANQPFTKIQP